MSTVTDSVWKQPSFVRVTTYVVVAVGVTIGVNDVESFNVPNGDQSAVGEPIGSVTVNIVLEPKHKLTSGEMVTWSKLVTDTVTLSVTEHLYPKVEKSG